MKRLIAFSSVAHMGFVMLGIATLTDFGINAAVFGMVAHGLITGMLFFVAGSVQHRYHTREMSRLGGLLTRRRRWAGSSASAPWRRSGFPASPGSGVSSRRSCRRIEPARRRPLGETAVVPHLHGDRGHRHRARRGLPAVDVPAGRDRQAEGRSSRTPTSTTCRRLGVDRVDTDPAARSSCSVCSRTCIFSMTNDGVQQITRASSRVRRLT